MYSGVNIGPGGKYPAYYNPQANNNGYPGYAGLYPDPSGYDQSAYQTASVQQPPAPQQQFDPTASFGGASAAYQHFSDAKVPVESGLDRKSYMEAIPDSSPGPGPSQPDFPNIPSTSTPSEPDYLDSKAKEEMTPGGSEPKTPTGQSGKSEVYPWMNRTHSKSGKPCIYTGLDSIKLSLIWTTVEQVIDQLFLSLLLAKLTFLSSFINPTIQGRIAGDVTQFGCHTS